jgi:hypothetical protein
MGSNTSTIISNETILFISLIYLYLHYSKKNSPSMILKQISIDMQDENIMKEEELKEELKWLEQVRNVSSKIISELKLLEDINYKQPPTESNAEENVDDKNITKEEELKEELEWLEQIRNVSGKIILELEYDEDNDIVYDEDDDDDEEDTVPFAVDEDEDDNKAVIEPEPKKQEKKLEEEIDITKYKAIIIGDNEYHKQRYGFLKTDNMYTMFKIYKVANYVGPKNFKIVSSKPIGTYDPKKNKLTFEDEIDIDITKYRTITIGDDEDDQQRYGCLKTANMDSKFKIYKVANYVGPKNFKIVSSKPIGTYDPENDELTLNEE